MSTDTYFSTTVSTLIYDSISSITTDVSGFETSQIPIGNDDRGLSEITTFDPLNITHVKSQATVARYLYKIVVPLVGVLLIVLNGMIVVSSGLILQRNIHPKTTYLFLGNVALCDLITGLATVFGAVFPISMRPHIVCCVQMGLIVSSTLASVWSIGLIAIDRFLFIVHGIRYTQWVYESRARLLIITTWILGLFIGFLPAMGWETGLTNNGKTCWFVILAPKNLLRLTVFFGLLPLVINLILYLIILYYAVQKVIQLQNADKGMKTKSGLRISRGTVQNKTTDEEAQQNQSPQQTASKWKAIKVVLFTSGAFLITWGPYFVTTLIYTSWDDPATRKHLELLISSPLAILGFVNSLLNPIIYAWWHKSFRKYTSIFLFRKKEPPSSQNTSSTHSSKMSRSSKSNSVSSNPQTSEVTHM